MESLKNALALLLGFMVICSTAVEAAGQKPPVMLDVSAVPTFVDEAGKVWENAGYHGAVHTAKHCHATADYSKYTQSGLRCWTLELTFARLSAANGHADGSFFEVDWQRLRMVRFLNSMHNPDKTFLPSFVAVYEPLWEEK